jgi:dolichol-phosphate mannosyltransferase
MPALHQLSVVLPVLNERDNLAELIPELCDVLTPVLDELELIVVDDSSTDGTDKFMAERVLDDDRIRYISRVWLVRSLPDSLSDGVHAARFPHVAWMDADGSMPPDSLRELVSSYRGSNENSPIVVGSRFVSGGGFKGVEIVGETSFWQVVRNLRGSNDSFSAVLLSRILNRYLWMILDRCCRDLASGFIIADRKTVLHLGLRGSYGDYCVRFLYLAHKLRHSLVEVPYVCQLRRHGYSKTGTTLWGLLKRGVPYVLLPFRIRWTRPQ